MFDTPGRRAGVPQSHTVRVYPPFTRELGGEGRVVVGAWDPTHLLRVHTRFEAAPQARSISHLFFEIAPRVGPGARGVQQALATQGIPYQSFFIQISFWAENPPVLVMVHHPQNNPDQQHG